MRYQKYQDKEGIAVHLIDPDDDFDFDNDVWLIKFFEFGEVLFLKVHADNLTQLTYPTPLLHTFGEQNY